MINSFRSSMVYWSGECDRRTEGREGSFSHLQKLSLYGVAAATANVIASRFSMHSLSVSSSVEKGERISGCCKERGGGEEGKGEKKNHCLAFNTRQRRVKGEEWDSPPPPPPPPGLLLLTGSGFSPPPSVPYYSHSLFSFSSSFPLLK